MQIKKPHKMAPVPFCTSSYSGKRSVISLPSAGWEESLQASIPEEKQRVKSPALLFSLHYRLTVFASPFRKRINKIAQTTL